MAKAQTMWRVAVVLGLMPAVAGATAQVDDYSMQPREVAQGVYAVVTPTRSLPNPQNKGWNSNSAFVVTGAGVLVFDTGSSEVIGRALKQAIARVTEQPVRWVVNSHGHGDHWLGNAAFVAEGVEFIASPQVGERMRTERDRWVAQFNRMTDGATGESSAVPPTTLIHQRTSRVLGGTKVVLIPSGNAHSPGDLLVWLPQRRALLAGDVVYSDRMPSTFDADVRQWIAFLKELETLDPPPEAVVAGHGKVTDLAGVRRLHALLADLWDAVSAGYQAGKLDYEMLPQVREALAGYARHYPGLEEKLRRDIGHVYLQVERASFQ